MSDRVGLVQPLIDDIREQNIDLDVDMVRRAFDYAESAHAEQIRRSGEPYVTHPVQVARILVELLGQRADAAILAAALLHDVVEDTGSGVADIEKEFGQDVALLVDGVTKIKGLPSGSLEQEQTETFRKMLLSMAKDVRVILIKLADRLHNMRTMDHMKPEKQQRISQETRDIYAPLAHRLGIATVKWELEDLALKYLDNKAYKDLARLIVEKREERERVVEAILGPIQEALAQEGVKAQVIGRPKHFDSIYRKMKRQNRPFDAIFDLIGVRILTETKTDCYLVLGVLHDLYKPVPDRFKDYIATPKSNLYQSLHTTVIGPGGRIVEVQIRTYEMHRISEYGIAAHYSYKEGSSPDPELDAKLGGLVGGTQEMEEGVDPAEYMDFLKTSLYQEEVFVFTPKGDLKQLPAGSTALDFAFSIHTDVGLHSVGARVNDRIVPLRYVLNNGDTISIITQPSAHPSESWLTYLASSRARHKVRHWLKEQRREDSISLGREMLQRELKRNRKPPAKDKDLVDVAQSLGKETPEQILAELGRGDVSVQSLVNRLHPDLQKEPTKKKSVFTRLRDNAAKSPIRIQDVDNLMMRLSKCCQPVPGEQIVGVVTRGRGLSIHRVDCPNGFEDKVGAERRVDVTWDVPDARAFVVKLLIYGSDSAGMLADLATTITDERSNIRDAGMRALDGDARGEFVIEVNNLSHLNRVIKAVKRVRGVRAVERSQISGGEL